MREGREAEAKEESAVSKVEGRRGGSGGGTSGEERRFEKEEDGGFNLEGLGIGANPILCSLFEKLHCQQ